MLANQNQETKLQLVFQLQFDAVRFMHLKLHILIVSPKIVSPVFDLEAVS